MLQRIIKKIIPIICSLIIGFSSLTVFASDGSDNVFSSSSIDLVCSSSEFTSTTSVPSAFRDFMSSSAYTYAVPNKAESLKIDFDFSFIDSSINKYKNYKIDFPLVLGLISNKISFSDFKIYFRIVYYSGSVSEYVVTADKLDNIGTSSRPCYDVPLSFVISGNKLLNIKDSYFLIDCSSMINSRCYFGLRNGSSFTVSKYSTDYNPFFSSSLNWVSDIFRMVSDNFPLVVLCIGVPVVAFSFLLLKRFIRS